MSLGDAFPSALKSASIKRQLVPGAVVKHVTVMDDGEVHEKRFVVIDVDEDKLTFACVINTNVPTLIQRNGDLLKCQVEMTPDKQPYMDWQSYIDCTRVRSYKTSDIRCQLERNPEWILGIITSDLRDAIVSALKFSPLIAPADIEKYANALDALG